MRKALLFLVIMSGMLIAMIFMAAAPSQAYMDPQQATTHVVKERRVVGLHSRVDKRTCTVTTDARTGEVLNKRCTRWHIVRYLNGGLPRH